MEHAAQNRHQILQSERLKKEGFRGGNESVAWRTEGGVQIAEAYKVSKHLKSYKVSKVDILISGFC